MTSAWGEQPVGIVGLGLIGGSLGLDLRAQGLEVRALVHREATAERARERGLADAVATDPAVLKGCGLIVLALPLDRLLGPDPALRAALPAEKSWPLMDTSSAREKAEFAGDRQVNLPSPGVESVMVAETDKRPKRHT